MGGITIEKVTIPLRQVVRKRKVLRHEARNMEYYIYYLHTDGYEDLAWYTEGVDEVSKQEAIDRLEKLAKNTNCPVRLYQIDRVSVKPGKQYRELVKEI